MITDISDDGARLYSDIAIPDEFILSMSGEGRGLRHECRVVWRLGGELGVEFLDRQRRLQPAPPPVAATPPSD